MKDARSADLPTEESQAVESSWVGHLLNEAAGRIRSSTVAALRPVGLTPPQLRALEAIAAAQPLTQVRLGELTGMDRTTVVHVVDRFEQLGAARREVDPSDRRSHAVRLTAAGARLLAAARARARAAEAAFLSPLSTADSQTLAALLRTLRDSVQRSEDNR